MLPGRLSRDKKVGVLRIRKVYYTFWALALRQRENWFLLEGKKHSVNLWRKIEKIIGFTITRMRLSNWNLNLPFTFQQASFPALTSHFAAIRTSKKIHAPGISKNSHSGFSKLLTNLGKKQGQKLWFVLTVLWLNDKIRSAVYFDEQPISRFSPQINFSLINIFCHEINLH